MKMEASPLILVLLLMVLKNGKFMYRSEEITRKRSIRHSIDSITIKWSSIEFISDYNNVIRRCFVTVSSLLLCLGTNGRSCSANNPPNQKASFTLAVILIQSIPIWLQSGGIRDIRYKYLYLNSLPECVHSLVYILYPEITWEQIFYIAQQQCRYPWRRIVSMVLYQSLLLYGFRLSSSLPSLFALAYLVKRFLM